MIIYEQVILNYSLPLSLMFCSKGLNTYTIIFQVLYICKIAMYFSISHSGQTFAPSVHKHEILHVSS
jgi:hypothetical protein